MKNNTRYIFILLFVLSAAFLTFLGVRGSSGVYSSYNYKYEDGPYLTLPFRGLQNNIPLFAAIEEKKPGNKKLPSASPDQAAFVKKTENGSSEAEAGDSGDTGASSTENADSQNASSEASSSAEETPVVDEQTAALIAEFQSVTITPASGTPADASYYSDALFIGDSRTVGLSRYLPEIDSIAHFYCQESLTAFNILTSPIVKVNDKSYTIEQALTALKFGKIYVMLGINEIGYPEDSFYTQFSSVIARIRELQPNATIYIQSIMHVSAAKAAQGTIYNNVNIDARNAKITALANGNDIIYIDSNYLLDDANGALNANYTYDGVHVTADAYPIWFQEIKEQTR